MEMQVEVRTKAKVKVEKYRKGSMRTKVEEKKLTQGLR